ncbi:Chromo domain protein [Pseudocohnilembus persalinus]|uniref:Chromo domain protein n=1 Tax=Pseudocohnilembus persalinus TaxID=266149 RepID=A0A0V0R8W2_PSEPJ|nr:Chromo domain protein [Pseudocohnilembus persalinus]|eukprot:KRX10927.1 Chromo domain protein [Pseudocohnilembus persalinus]
MDRQMDKIAPKNDQVEEIIGKNIIDGQFKFQVKWKKSGQYTWETVEDLQNNMDLLSEYIVYEEQNIRKKKMKFEMELMGDLKGSDEDNENEEDSQQENLVMGNIKQRQSEKIYKEQNFNQDDKNQVKNSI